VLLDVTPAVADAVRRAVESDADNKVVDLHVWRVGPGHIAAVLSVITREPRPPAHYKSLLAAIPTLSHVTVEVETPDAMAGAQRESDGFDERRIHTARRL
jgi:Co/Zn/Cd efflux system component